MAVNWAVRPRATVDELEVTVIDESVTGGFGGVPDELPPPPQATKVVEIRMQRRRRKGTDDLWAGFIGTEEHLVGNEERQDCNPE